MKQPYLPLTILLAVITVPSTAWALEKQVSLMTGQAIGDLAVAGRLSVDLHGEFMVSRTYDKDTVLNWYNCGYSGGGRGTVVGGNFGDFGFQVPWRERDTRYPHAVTLGKVHAVQFRGTNTLTGNFPVEPQIAGAQRMALEVWLRIPEAPARDAVILGWQSADGRERSAALRFPGPLKQGPQWQHLVVNCTPTVETWYLDGRKIASGPRVTIIKPGHVMVLGGASATTPSFRGELAAVRLHDKEMTEEQIAHNFQGGVMLGTEMHNWWRTEPGKWFVVESEHFRHCVDKQEMAGWNEKQHKEFDGRVPGMLHLAELVYHTYSERLALRIGVVSRRPEKRGDGIKYKIPIQPTPGGSYMGVDDDFGWSCQFAGFINPHELVHGCQTMTGGMYGNYWETHANFPQIFNGIYQTIPIISKECAAFPSNGRVYYHDRLMFEHLAASPQFGPMFISKLWYDGPTAQEKNPYPWLAFTEIVPDGWNVLATEWARMVQRLVIYDFPTYDEAKPGEGNTPHGNDGVLSKENRYQRAALKETRDIQRYARIILTPVPNAPDWWQPPKEQAPQQLGWNIIPLQFKPGMVSVNLEGYVNPARGGNWRAGFVGVNREGKPVYGGISGPGKSQSFQVGEDIKELYLTVCAVPSRILPIVMTGDFRSPEQEQFPYRVKFEGCSPGTPRQIDFPVDPKGHPHPNGGGFVADSAHADDTAFVGREAKVLGTAKVLDHARIEDNAVVINATVKDDAAITDYAVIENDSVVGGHAKVRDFACVTGQSKLQGDARVLEHAVLNSKKTCADMVTVKGCAHVYGGNQSGTAIIDGYYAKGNDITGGKWFTWSWGQGKNPGETNDDFGGLYADYDFSTRHPWMADDSFGATWGYYVGTPQFVLCPDREVRNNTLRQPESVLPKLDQDQNNDKNYAQLLTTYLRPPETGDYTFWISADDEGELWIGNAGTDKADKKLCGNPFWAGFRDYNRFPSQKSPTAHLLRGMTYPLKVIHSNVNMGGSLSVSWAKSGMNKPEPIPNECLSLTADGRKPGVRQRIWGDVPSVADLVKRADYPDGFTRGGGGALVLNGKDQFVELPKDIADMREFAYTVDFKWTGGINGARVFEFSNPNGDAVWLNPWENGKLVFAIRHGTKIESLTAQGTLRGVWNRVRVSSDGKRTVLFVNGRKVAENNDSTLSPDSVRATQCYLGRGLTGGYFGGQIARFTIYSQASDTTK